MNVSPIRYVLVAVTVAALAGCGSAPVPHSPSTLVPGAANSAATAPAAVSVTIPRGDGTSAQARRAQYISAQTQSVTISVDGATPVVVDTTPSSPGCSEEAGGLVCSTIVDAPLGDVTFTVATYDQLDGAGNRLSESTTTMTIVAGVTNQLPIVLGGIVHSISLSLSPQVAQIERSATIQVNVVARDANGSIITGSGSYLDKSGNPETISLSSGDSNGVLSAASVASPSDSITLAYNGHGSTTTPIVITATPSDSSLSPQTADLNPTKLQYTSVEYPVPTAASYLTGIAIGSDGAVWFTETFGNKAGRLDPATGNIVEYPLPTVEGQSGQQVALGVRGDLIAGADGFMYFLGNDNITDAGVPSNVYRLSIEGATTTSQTTITYGGQRWTPDGYLALSDDGHIAFAYYCYQSVIPGMFLATNAGVATSNLINPGAGRFAVDDSGVVWWSSTTSSTTSLRNSTGLSYTDWAMSPNHYPSLLAPGPGNTIWMQLYGSPYTVDIYDPVTGSSTQRYTDLFTDFYHSTSDDAMWAAGQNELVRFGRYGSIDYYEAPNVQSVTVAPDGTVWFTDRSGNAIGKLAPVAT